MEKETHLKLTLNNFELWDKDLVYTLIFTLA